MGKCDVEKEVLSSGVRLYIKMSVDLGDNAMRYLWEVVAGPSVRMGLLGPRETWSSGTVWEKLAGMGTPLPMLSDSDGAVVVAMLGSYV